MSATPEIVERPAQPYAAIPVRVAMAAIGGVVPPLNGEVFRWLAERGVAPAGPPFWKYNVIDMDRDLEVEVGVPVPGIVDGDDRVLAGLLPAGRYATLRYTGHPDGLLGATGSLQEWAGQQNLTWDVARTEDGERWAARLEIYETDPAVQPDMNKWVTQLAFRLAGP